MNKKTSDIITNLSHHLLKRAKRDFSNDLYIESTKLFIEIVKTLSNEVIDKEALNNNNISEKENPAGANNEI
jgi:hypothetical protein